MSIRPISLMTLLAIAIFLSGCVSYKDSNKVNNSTITPTESGFFPKANLPPGYSFETVYETKEKIGNSSFNATGGLYKYNSGYAEILAIEHENPTSLMGLYRSQYDNVTYNPFEEISFNNHKATIVTRYFSRDGKEEPKYTVIWTNGSYLFIARNEEQTDANTIVSFATASGH